MENQTDKYRKEIRTVWRKEGNAKELTLTICYILHGDKASMQFTIRCPTESWHYWLPTGIDYHADEQQYEGQTPTKECTARPQGFCYCDGSSLAADDLLKKFINCGLDENIIWQELTKWMEDRFK